MGGGRQFLYPKWVWSPAGGWWPNPVNKNRNTALFLGAVGVAAYFLKSYADKNTVCFGSPKIHIQICSL